jgi:hypothetical protein
MDQAPRVIDHFGREPEPPRPVDAPETQAEKKAVDDESIEVMAVTSPEGRPPHLHERRRTSAVILIAVLIFIASAIALVQAGGWSALGIGLLYMVGLVGAAFPVWVAALFRRKEEERAHDQAAATIRHDHRPRPV